MPIPLWPSQEELAMSEDRIEAERDEFDEVLSVLEGLIQKVSSPVIRGTLEEAREDIAHLTGRDAVPKGSEWAAA
jgi:hypothetical protein